MPERPDLAPLIDHTLLAVDATGAAVDRLCAEARVHGFASVCVAGPHVRRAARGVGGSAVGVSAVVGFPSGAVATRVKAVEAALAIGDGADELDVVADLGAIRAGAFARVEDDLRAVVAAARRRPVKAILETALFPREPDRIRRAVEAAVRAGVAWVKTSTGFGPGGATVDAVALLAEAAAGRAAVKAAGGIRTGEDADRMVAAGASRLGSSRGVVIVGGEERTR